MSKAAVGFVVVFVVAVISGAGPPAATAYSACNLTAVTTSSVVGRCGGARILLTGGSTKFGRIGSARTRITFTSASMFGTSAPRGSRTPS